MLSEDQRQKIAAQFNQFFELTPVEKKKTLNTLSDAERQQMEKTLETFGKLPPAQRQKCIRAFTEFAGMSARGKTGFFEERPALVANVAEGTPDLARSRHARPRMAAVAVRAYHAAHAAYFSSGSGHQPRLSVRRISIPISTAAP